MTPAEEQAIVEDVWDDWPERCVGTELDVRAVMAAIPQVVKEHLRYDEVPWQRFPHAYGPGEEIPGILAILASGDTGAADQALFKLWNCICHQGSTSATAALAVPFLLRIAVGRTPQLRAEILTLIAEVGRRSHFGEGSRSGFLQVADDGLMFDGPPGCPANWAVEAARDAIASDLHLLLPLVNDPAPEVRSAACYALAASLRNATRISAVLQERLIVEGSPAVRMGLVLAIAQLAREHDFDQAAGWARDRWSDPGQPLEIRIGAALAWLTLVGDPVPDELRTLLTDSITDERADLLKRVPWLPPVDREHGLRRCVHEMLDPGAP